MPGIVRIYQKPVYELSQELSAVEVGALFTLSGHINPHNLIVQGDTTGINYPMTLTDIAKSLGVTVRRTSDILKRLVEHGALREMKRGTTKHYTINPYYVEWHSGEDE